MGAPRPRATYAERSEAFRSSMRREAARNRSGTLPPGGDGDPPIQCRADRDIRPYETTNALLSVVVGAGRS